MARPAIEVVGLQKRYRTGGEILRSVTFSVDPGEVFGYLARNGQGKTTSVRILTGLTLASEGAVRVCGLDVAAARAEVQARIGVTLQDAAIDDALTGRQFLTLVASLMGFPRRVARERADELLELFGLVEAAGKRIGAYSGGMQRRIDLAAALVRRPEILFLDEPTTGLDPQSRRTVWDEIRRLRSEGTTVFLTTQYIEEADALADRIGVLHGGTIVATGTPAALRAAHAGTTVRVTLDPKEAQRLAARLDGQAHVGADGTTVIIDAGPTEAALRIASSLTAEHLTGGGLEIRQSSLEDAFLALTGPEPVRVAA